MENIKLDCPYDFTSRCTMGDCDCKPKVESVEAMETKQTAVEWLVKQIENHIHHTIRIPSEYVEQAKEMEKQQIMMAVTDSWYMAKGSDFQELQAEQYYIEEYGGNK